MEDDDPRTRAEVTRLLQELDHGATAARDALLPVVYGRLRAMAEQRMSAERAGHTLQATALVHEAWVRLLGAEGTPAQFENRRHFFGAAAEAMRRILVDHARARGRLKRGGDRRREALVDLPESADCADPDHLLALDAALQRLAGEDPRAAEIVRLRFFAGLSAEEAADVLGLSRRSVLRDWAFARARLWQLLEGEEPHA